MTTRDSDWQRYRWVDERGYLDGEEWIARGICPVIAPREPARREIWSGILDWYHMTPAGRGRATRRAAPIAKRRGHLVISVGIDFLPAARVLAAASGRGVVTVRSLRSADLPPCVRKATSLVLLGPPSLLPVELITALGTSLSVPWGVLTARTLAAISLMVAKQLARMPADHRGVLLIDALAGTAQRDDGAGPAMVAAREVAHQLLRSHRTVVMHAHGEGGHVNLDSVVLCGQAWGEERTLRDGAPVTGGCCARPGVRRCKRSRGSSALMGVGEVRSEQLCLLSCNGFAVAGELYPTDISCVLAAAEGYPRAALVTDRSLGFAHHLPLCAAQLFAQGESLGAAQGLLNDLESRCSGTRPYVLCGDPCAPGVDGGFIGGSGATVAQVTQPPLPASREVGVLEIGNGALLRGTRSGLSWNTTAPVAWSDRDVAWSQQNRWLGLLWHRAGAIQRWMMGIRSALAPAQNDAMAVALDAQEALTHALLQRLMEQARLLERIRMGGLWDQRAMIGFDLILIEVAQWDHTFASLLDRHLLTGDLINALLTGLRLERPSCGPPCPRCQQLLEIAKIRDPLTGHHTATRLHCRICGAREWHAQGGIRLGLEAPTAVGAGGCLRITARDLTAVALRFTPMPRRQVVVHFREKAGSGGGAATRRLVQTSHLRRDEYLLGIPGRCAPDLHTLQVAWVHGLSLSVIRQRCLCMERLPSTATMAQASAALDAGSWADRQRGLPLA